MKNLKPFFWMFLCLMVPFLVACPDNGPDPKSKTELITKNWKVRQVSVENSGQTTIVYTNPTGSTPNTQDYSAYRLNFKNATNFARTEPGGAATTEGTWQFDDNGNPKKITFSTGNPTEINVKTLEENRLIISYVTNSSKTGNSESTIELIPAE